MRNTGAALRFAMKILRELATGGVIQSHKGVSGGYELAWEPESITLAEEAGIIGGLVVSVSARRMTADAAAVPMPQREDVKRALRAGPGRIGA